VAGAYIVEYFIDGVQIVPAYLNVDLGRFDQTVENDAVIAILSGAKLTV
jgi:hypothetical protein